jgi:hypothetical protein
MVVLAVAAEAGGGGRWSGTRSAVGGCVWGPPVRLFFFLLQSVVDSLTRWALEDCLRIFGPLQCPHLV